MSETCPVFSLSEFLYFFFPFVCSNGVVGDNYCKCHGQQYWLCCVFVYKLSGSVVKPIDRGRGEKHLGMLLMVRVVVYKIVQLVPYVTFPVC